MNKKLLFNLPYILFLIPIHLYSQENKPVNSVDTIVHYQDEKHFKSVRQLTFGGDNAEAYFSFNNKMISFQVTNPSWNVSCDQIYFSSLENFLPVKVSTGKGRTTCSYFLPGDSLILYASTHESSVDCPLKPAPREDHKYVWPVYSSFDIYVSDLKGKIKKKLTDLPGYDAEATLSPKGDKIVFTSLPSIFIVYKSRSP